MGLLYDLVQEFLWIPTFGLQWSMMPVEKGHDVYDEILGDDDEEYVEQPFQPIDHVAMMFSSFVGCIPVFDNLVSPHFKSQGYKKVEVQFKGDHDL